ncbi:HAD family hydrolase [Butyrivibrio sp. VCB2001]|uniref:HAD family hydrolase n=1 Tax=Butyrivibrio sp. VCB2001 TaxID=1280667 RepID=UPI00041B2CF1|nr:HAD family phosphatase [Butyrivibrio sp. VCB2001]
MRDFDAVVFDMDGIIFDSERAVLESWYVVADRHDLGDITEAFLACTGVNDKETKEIMLRRFGEDFPYDEYSKEASVIFHEKYDGGKLPMKIGVKEILTFLKDSGKKIALASSTRRPVVEAELRDAGVLEFFDELVTGDVVKRSKPDPEIYLLACEKIGVAPERCYAIEDSYNGVRSASGGGLKAIMVPDLLPANDEMKKLTESVQESLLDVIEYLKGE